MVHIINKIRKSLVEDDFKKTKKKVAGKLRKKILGQIYFKEYEYIISWDLTKQRKFQLGNKITLEYINKELLHELKHLNVPENIVLKFSNYLDSEFKGVIAKIEDQIVGYIWWFEWNIGRDKYHPSVEIHEIEMNQGEVYMFDNRVIAEYKGNATGTEMLYLVQQELLNSGHNIAKAVVNKENIAARWLYSIHGWQYGELNTRHIFLRKFLICRNRLFKKNSVKSAGHKFDYRLIFPKNRV